MSKIGRPKVSKGEAKSEFRGAFFARDEAKQIDHATKQAGQRKSQWLRETAVEKANYDLWGNCKFTAKELDGERIEFALHSPEGVTSGIGKISAIQNPQGLVRVDIFIHVPPVQSGEIVEYRIWIEKRGVEMIELNPDPTRAKFRLLA